MMNLAPFTRCERIVLTKAEMVVVRSYDDILRRELRVAPRQLRHHVRNLSVDSLNIHGQRQPCGSVKGHRMIGQVSIDSLPKLLYAMPGRLQPTVHGLHFHLNDGDRHFLRTAHVVQPE